MAEFCLECLNKVMQTDYKESQVTIDDELDLCEGCGKMKLTVVTIKPTLLQRIQNLFGR